jgi:hypothetical protein
MRPVLVGHETAARALLALALLPFLYFAVRDQVLHLTVRRVPVAENVVHALLAVLLAAVIVRAFLFDVASVAGGVLAFALVGAIDEFGFHRGLPSDEHDVHAKEHFALLLFVAVFGVVAQGR